MFDFIEIKILFFSDAFLMEAQHGQNRRKNASFSYEKVVRLYSLYFTPVHGFHSLHEDLVSECSTMC